MFYNKYKVFLFFGKRIINYLIFLYSIFNIGSGDVKIYYNIYILLVNIRIFLGFVWKSV